MWSRVLLLLQLCQQLRLHRRHKCVLRLRYLRLHELRLQHAAMLCPTCQQHHPRTDPTASSYRWRHRRDYCRLDGALNECLHLWREPHTICGVSRRNAARGARSRRRCAGVKCSRSRALAALAACF